MNALDLIHLVESLGVTLAVDGQDLVLRGDVSRLPPDLPARLTAKKPIILRHITGDSAPALCSCVMCAPALWDGFPAADVATWPAKWRERFEHRVGEYLVSIEHRTATLQAYRDTQGEIRSESGRVVR